MKKIAKASPSEMSRFAEPCSLGQWTDVHGANKYNPMTMPDVH